ncbi:hypothetical protein HF521_008505, partial [Silurus meridionalis]
VPLSDGTVSRHITDMAQDIKCQLIDRVKKSGRYSLQLDESTDVSSIAQLLVFVRYIFEGKLHEEMLFCTQLEGSCTGDDIFNKLDSKLKDEGLSWGECISVCTDGAGAMLGKKKRTKGTSPPSCTSPQFHTLYHTQRSPRVQNPECRV